MRILRLLSNLRRRDRREDELDEELRFHVDMEAERGAARGVGREQALREARVRFGSREAVREECREAWGVRMVETFVEDVRGALRQLRSSPAFAAAIVLTLGLGIGANAAIFALVDAVLLRPLPYDRGDRVVALSHRSDADDHVGFSPPEIRDYREQVTALEAVVEYHSMPFTLLGDRAERVQVAVVSAEFFDVLGIRALHGRTFLTGEDQPGAAPVLVLTHGYWMRNLGGDPSAIGRTVRMNDRVHTVVGILPPVTLVSEQDEVFMPVSSCPFRSAPTTVDNRKARMLTAFGRLRGEATAGEADRELQAVSGRLAAEYPDQHRGNVRAAAVGLRETLIGDAKGSLLALLGAVGCLLLIVCANVANLMLARIVHREKEIALRSALGAGRGRLLRQLVTEATVLALVGGIVGVGVAAASIGMLRAFAERFTPRAAEAALDGRILLFTLALSVVSGVLAGSLPGLPAERRLSESLRDGGGRAGVGPRQGRLRNALVTAQIAIALVLLVGAALLLRSALNLQQVDPGFRPDQVVSMRVSLNWSRYTQVDGAADRQRAFFAPLLTRLRATPGIAGAALGVKVPLDGTSRLNAAPLRVEGRDPDAAVPQADVRVASEDWFRTLGVPVLRGRAFAETDGPGAELVVVVNQSLARRLFGEADPVGRRVSLDDGANWWTVVGMVGDVRQYGLDRDAADEIYVPFAQNPVFAPQLAVRTSLDASAAARRVREAVAELDPETPVSDVHTLAELRQDALAGPRLIALLQVLFSVLALAVTAAGLGGVIAYGVSRRTQEIGIRMALGAERGHVVGLVVRQGLMATLTGVALGAIGALALGHMLQGLLFGVQPTDAICFVGSAAVLVAVAAIACLLPARRATAIDPLVALR